MRLRVVFFARLRREFGIEQVEVSGPDGATVRSLATLLEEQYGVSLRGCMAAVNEHYAQPDRVLDDGDEVAFLPPVAGGEAQAEDSEDLWAGLTEHPLRLEEAERHLVRPAYGAQAYFVGTVRSPNHGRAVDYIDYEGYEALAGRVMREAATEARRRHGDLRLYLQHRVGRLRPGEASILIGVASPHRRAALEACDFLIEYLKVHVPVWKHEVDESGAHWVDGQTPHPTL